MNKGKERGGGGDTPEKVQMFNALLPQLFTKRNSVQIELYRNIPPLVHL